MTKQPKTKQKYCDITSYPIINDEQARPQSKLSDIFDVNRNRVSIYLRASLKKTILIEAMRKKASAGAIIIAALRKAFPESRTDLENRELINPWLPKYGYWNSKHARRQLASTENCSVTRINFRMPGDLKSFLEKKAEEPNSLLDFEQLIETTLELEFDSDDDTLSFVDFDL